MAANDRSTGRACRNFEADLVLYHYGDCTDPERLRVEAHVKLCPGCTRYLHELEALLPLTMRLDEPPERFWVDYTGELRAKLSATEAKASWWNWRETLHGFYRYWPAPALATALALILGLTLISTKKSWQPNVIPPEEEALLEALPMAENLEFFKAMELLDALDLLEASADLSSGSA